MVVFGVPIVVLLLMVTSVYLIMTRRPNPATGIAPTPAAPTPAAPKVLPLAGTEWQCLTIAGMPVKDPQPPTLAFGADGRASGFAGVNRYGGSWEAAAGTALKLGPMAATRMAGPPERMDLEQRFLAALEGVESATVQGPTLTLHRGATVTATFGKVLAGPGAATAK